MGIIGGWIRLGHMAFPIGEAAAHHGLLMVGCFLGFSFSMIWAHAPIILPMVFKLQINIFHPILWLGWIIFQVSLVGRIASAWLGDATWRMFFGVANGWAILLMFLMMGTLFLYRKNRLKSGVAKKHPPFYSKDQKLEIEGGSDVYHKKEKMNSRFLQM